MRGKYQRIILGKALLCAALALSACTGGSLEELRNSAPSGTPLQNRLAALYLDYAQGEAQKYDWSASQRFADKGLTAAYGHDVEPETAADWGVPTDQREDLEKARMQLLDAMKSDRFKDDPDRLAYAIFYYDCWVENQAEKTTGDDIDACKQSFYSSIDTSGEEEDDEKDEAVTTSDAPPVISTSYLVFFPFGKHKLVKETVEVLDRIAEEIKNAPADYTITLNGHTDRAGPEQFNLELSQQRAEVVKKALIKRGIPKKRMETFAFGESDPRVPTKDGVAEKANRRVEIFINP